MKPYYQDAHATIYHGDCREILPELQDVASIVTDPPYGINYRSNHNSSRRGQWAKWVRYENMPGIQGDDAPLDPAPLLALNVPTVIFGGNYCADQLPPSRCWIVWNKRDGIGPNNQADCEMAWTNLDKPARIFDHLWSGLLRAGAENVTKAPKYHPHQKPVALLQRVLLYGELCGPILDPYAGSCSLGVAAKNLGLRSVLIEIEERYCEAGVKRLRQEPLPLCG